MPANTAIVIEPLEYIREFNSQRVSIPLSVSKNWLRHVFRVNTERLHIGAVSAPCKETLAAQGIENLTHMSSDSVESLWGLRLRASVSKKWLRHFFRVNTERLHIGAVSAPCKETLAAQGIENLTHMSSDSVESLWGLRLRINSGFF